MPLETRAGSESPPEFREHGDFFAVHLGSYLDPDHARQLRESLLDGGIPVSEQWVWVRGRHFLRLYAGRFASEGPARQMQREFLRRGRLEGTVVLIEADDLRLWPAPTASAFSEPTPVSESTGMNSSGTEHLEASASVEETFSEHEPDGSQAPDVLEALAPSPSVSNRESGGENSGEAAGLNALVGREEPFAQPSLPAQGWGQEPRAFPAPESRLQAPTTRGSLEGDGVDVESASEIEEIFEPEESSQTLPSLEDLFSFPRAGLDPLLPVEVSEEVESSGEDISTPPAESPDAFFPNPAISIPSPEPVPDASSVPSRPPLEALPELSQPQTGERVGRSGVRDREIERWLSDNL